MIYRSAALMAALLLSSPANAQDAVIWAQPGPGDHSTTSPTDNWCPPGYKYEAYITNGPAYDGERASPEAQPLQAPAPVEPSPLRP
jgi:hypothetical protein